MRFKTSIVDIVASEVLTLLAFFLITNGAVWLCGDWYPKTLAGLVECFVSALPFSEMH